jgi:hypothetical protein
MKRILQSIFIAICLVTSSGAQSSDWRRLEWMRQELALRALENAPAQAEREISQRRRAEFLERQFVARMNEFIVRWEALAQEYNTKKVFNIKRAKELTKAFRALEDTEGWPKIR